MSNNGTPFSEAGDAATSAMDAFFSAQKRWMKQVMAPMQGSAASAAPWARLAQQWQDALMGGMGAWSDESEPVVKATLERMARSQSAMMELFQLAFDATAQISRQAADSDDLPGVIEEKAEALDEQVRHAISTWSTAAKDVQAMWERFTDDLQAAGLPFDVMLRMPGMMQPPAEGERESPLRTLFDQMYKTVEVENIMERLLDSPGIGLSREFNEKVQRGFKAYQAYQRAAVRYQSIVANIWGQALQRFIYEVGERVRAGEDFDELRDLTTIWTRVADDVFITAFRSDDYIDAQSDLLSAAMRFRTRRRAILEEYQRALDQPTRSELDEVHELLYRLRKENKALRSELDALADEVHALRAGDAAPASAATAADSPDDLTVISGIGGATAERLQAAGLGTFAALAQAPAQTVRAALSRPIGDEQIAAWTQAAKDRM